MKKNNIKGFTLVEIIAVVVILGIVMIIAIPNVNKTVKESKKDTFIVQVKNFKDAMVKEDQLKNGLQNEFKYGEVLDNNDEFKGYGRIEGNNSYVTLCNELYCVVEVDAKNVSLNNLIDISNFTDSNFKNLTDENIKTKAGEYAKKKFEEAAEKYYRDTYGDEGDIGYTIKHDKDEQTIRVTYEDLSNEGYIGKSKAFSGYAIVSNKKEKEKVELCVLGEKNKTPIDSDISSNCENNEGTRRDYSKSEFMKYVFGIASEQNEIGCVEKSDDHSNVVIYNEGKRKIIRAIYERQTEDALWYYLIGVQVVEDQKTGKKVAIMDYIDQDTPSYDSTISNLNYGAIEYNNNGEKIDYKSEISCQK